MARPLRIHYPGAIYHVTARGNDRQDLFLDDRDRERFLGSLAQCVDAYGVRLYLFCLMTNHVHLVLETPQGNLSRFMQTLQTAYSMYHNRRHERAGHRFQGRYGARLVEADEYLLALSRYVHLNPVHVGKARGLSVPERVEVLRDYAWSSYRGYTGRSRELPFVEYAGILSSFGGKRSDQRRAYEEYVESGIAESDRELRTMLKKPWPAIGSDPFRAWVMDEHERAAREKRRPEDVTFCRMEGALGWRAVLKEVARALETKVELLVKRRRGTPDRAVAARMLCRFSGLTMRETAGILGLRTGAAVTWQLRRLEEALAKDADVRRRVIQLEETLTSQRLGAVAK